MITKITGKLYNTVVVVESKETLQLGNLHLTNEEDYAVKLHLDYKDPEGVDFVSDKSNIVLSQEERLEQINKSLEPSGNPELQDSLDSNHLRFDQTWER